MTTANNNEISKKTDRTFYPVLTDGTGDFNQGDQLYYDTTNHVVKPLGSSDDTNANTFVGVAADTSYINPYGTKMYQPQQGVYITGIFNFKTTSGDTYQHGDAVYVGADAQTVTNTVGGLTKKLGYVQLRPGQAAPAGGASVTIDVLIVPQYPTTAIA